MDTSKKASSDIDIRREACDLSGHLGSLYDARRDSFVKHHSLLREPNWYTRNVTPVCYWWQSDESNDSEIPLNNLKIAEELCLSLYLGMCGSEPNGRASLINYGKPISSQTFFLLYSYKSRDQWLPQESFLASSFFANGTFDTLSVDATHIVHGIEWGFEVLFVIDVPDSINKTEDNDDIARLLDKICVTLKQHASLPIKLTKDEQNLWTKLSVHIQTTSTRLSFDQATHILSIIYRIQHFEYCRRHFEYPLVYILQPIQWIYDTISDLKYKCFEIDFSKESKTIQRQLYLVQNALNRLTVMLQLLEETDQEKIFVPQTKDIKNKLHQLQDKRRELLENLRTILMDVRQGRQDAPMLFKITEDSKYDLLRISTLKSLIEQCNVLYRKAQIIDQLRKEHFEYVQIADGKSASTKERITKLFINSIRPVNILCSSDALIEQDEQQWNTCRQELITKRNEDSNVRLIYADLSYCKHKDMKKTCILPDEQQVAEPEPLPPDESLQQTEINVLLLGESGVGKSTFINAFVNYLTFDSLQQAEAGEPSVLIPVSFLTTVTDKFEEVVVKFGDIDVNEDHDHPGQSVTQYCRSYVFDISHKTRLRLIDTPGIGDTRGLDQDQKNIDRTLSYINNFSYINAVCILLKPNATRLNVFFRSCIMQLFTYLTPAARDNIIFCFTNTRSTFFAPGNTAPLLKLFLKELYISDIPFNKTNSFCFDSESFRYLIAVRSKIVFDEYQRQECHKSWTASVIESERLFKFICMLKPYLISQWQSTNHAQIEINMMIRPIMEAFRTLLINMILQGQQRNNVSIVLRPKQILESHTLSAVCHETTCGFIRVQCDRFFIVRYPVHQVDLMISDTSEQCKSCQCDITKHAIIDYELNYEVLTTTEPTEPIDNDKINQWINLCVAFASFISSVEVFLVYFDQFIDEERLLKLEEQASKGPKSTVNALLNDILINTKSTFEIQMQTKNVEKKPNLDEIYKWINWAKSLSDISSQIDAIQQSRTILLKSQERFIAKPLQCTGILTRLAEQSS